MFFASAFLCLFVLARILGAMFRITLLLFFFAVFERSQAQQTVFKRIDLNDEVRVEAYVLKDDERIPHGKYRQLYRANKHVEGAYKKGRKHGVWERFYPTGAVMIQANYVNGLPSGTWKRFDINGTEVAQFSFAAGVPTGHWSSKLVTGAKGMDLIFENGLLIQGILYHPDGKPALLVEQQITGGDTLLYRSVYYPNHRIKSYEEFKNGIKHGSHIIYYANGARKEELIYQEGKLHEVESLRSLNGQPLQKGNLTAGTGELNGYYPNGMLFYKKNYLNGELHDTTLFFSGGKPIFKGSYNHGKAVGTHTFADEDYSVEVILRHSEGEAPLAIRYLSAAVQEVEKGPLKDGVRTGTWIRTNPYGVPVRKAEFVNGLMQGNYQEFSPSGNDLKIEGSYVCGAKTGVWRSYNAMGKVTYVDSMNNQISCAYNPLSVPEPGFVPVEENNGYWFLNEDALAKPFRTKNLLHYAPPLPGAYLLREEPTYEAQVIDFFKPEIKMTPEYLPFFIPAHYPGEDGAELTFLEMHPVLSEAGRKRKVKGSILVRFRVDELGVIDGVELLRCIHPEIDVGALEFVRQLTAWEPALYNGMPVATYVLKRMDVNYEEN